MHAIFIAAGTLGDVLPILSLANIVGEHGWKTTLIAPATYRTMAAYSVGAFIPLASDEECAMGNRDMFLLSTRYRALFMRRYAAQWNRNIYRTLRELTAPDTAVITAARGFLWADICAAAHLDLPVFRAHIDPPGLSKFSPVKLPASSIQRRLVGGYESEWQRLAGEIGLSVGGNHIARLTRRRNSIPSFGLYPPWLVDVGSRRSIPPLGFCPLPPLPPQNSAALPNDRASEEKFIIFMVGTQGTTSSWTARCFHVASQVCRTLTCRGLMIGVETAGVNQPADEFLTSMPFAPLDRALSRAHAIVHHGGIGTAAAALRANVPQVIVPRVFCQHYNADCLDRAGVASVVRAENFTANRVLGAIHAAKHLADHTITSPNRKSDDFDAYKLFGFMSRVLPGSAAPQPPVKPTPQLLPEGPLALAHSHRRC